jgi:hypothetical protein
MISPSGKRPLFFGGQAKQVGMPFQEGVIEEGVAR